MLRVCYNLFFPLLNFVGLFNNFSTRLLFRTQFWGWIATYSLGNRTDALFLLWLFQYKSFLCAHSLLFEFIQSFFPLLFILFLVHLQDIGSLKQQKQTNRQAKPLSFSKWLIVSIFEKSVTLAVGVTSALLSAKHTLLSSLVHLLVLQHWDNCLKILCLTFSPIKWDTVTYLVGSFITWSCEYETRNSEPDKELSVTFGSSVLVEVHF